MTDKEIIDGLYEIKNWKCNGDSKMHSIIRGAIKALEQTRWIPCSERLPEEYGEYICTMSNGDIQECGFVPSGEKELIPGWSTCEADGFKKLDYQDVIAWMPLPSSYQGESEDKE